MELRAVEKFFIWSVLFLFAVEFVQCYFGDGLESHCTEYICADGYTYSKFYPVSEADGLFAPGVKFEMNLVIHAPSNVYILFSSNQYPESDDYVYEIVLGAGENTYSALRLQQDGFDAVTSYIKNVLATYAFRSFWIKIMKDGLIEVGREGVPGTLLRYRDPNPIYIRFFSFATYHNIPARILFDCKLGMNFPHPAPSRYACNKYIEEVTCIQKKPTKDACNKYIEEVKSIQNEPTKDAFNKFIEEIKCTQDILELTTPQKLHENITRRGRGRPDEDMTIIYVTGTIADLRFDSDNCFLEATMTVVMSWTDKAISWQPEVYHGIDHVSVRNKEIWTPELVLYNAVGHGVIEPSESERLLVASEGVARLSMRMRQQVNCIFSDDVQYRWPRDEYECNFLIGPWSMQDHLTVKLLTNDSVANSFGTTATLDLSTQWDVIHINRSILTSKHNDRPHHGSSNSNSDEAQTVFKIHVSIRRKSYTYYLFLTVPFTVIITMILLSFFLNPLSEGRVLFNCSMLVIICMFVMYLDTIVPSYTTPLILIYYTIAMFMLTAMLLVQVILKHPPCTRLTYFRPVMAAIGCHQLKTYVVNYSVGDDCSKIGDVTSGERKSDNVATKKTVLIVYRFVFGIYIAIYVTMMVTIYL